MLLSPLAVLGLLLATGSASAQPTAIRSPEGVDVGDAGARLHSVGEFAPSRRATVSPTGAVLISIGVTGALIGGALQSTEPEGTDARTAALVGAGVVLGPSAGNVAVGNARGALLGIGLRLLGGAVGVASATAGYVITEDRTVAIVLLANGALISLGGTAFDLVSAGAHARRARLRPTPTGLALAVGL
ncbi:hypothetical protein [Rubrivirga sp. IMCC45206]|uniref:hypothetical protein n=1 Tax=Rubrivirga sp. IMCC45206 TaxID=3391614 RepID=UPI00398FF659